MTIKIKILLILLLTAMVSAAIFFVVRKKDIKKDPGKLLVSLSVFQTSIGWGYKIDLDQKTFVYQPFVPVVETHSGFESREVAERAGWIVVNKIMRRQSPSLTLKDLQMAGVNIEKLWVKKLSID